jgi:hypothetical protein
MNNRTTKISGNQSPVTGNRSLFASLLLALFAASAPAAVLTMETFDSNAGGWTDSGNLSSVHSAAEGNAPGSLQGTMGPGGGSGSFTIDSGTDFLGAYPGVDNLTAFTFDLMAEDELPLDVSLRFYSSSYVYTYFIPFAQVSAMTLGDWSTFEVPLTYASGWLGDPAQFSISLGSVSTVQVTIARNPGFSSLDFYLDNFGTLDDPLDPGDPLGAVPEPSTGLIVLYGGMYLYAIRRRLTRGRANEYEEEWS